MEIESSQINFDKKKGIAVRSLASEIIAKVGPSLGLKINLEPEYRHVGQIVTPDGRKFYFRNTNFDLNGQGASEMARDKGFAAYYLKLMGYPVPEGRNFYSPKWCEAIGSDQNIDAGYVYARTLEFPVIVKPNSKSQGSGVAKVHNKREFYKAMRGVFNKSHDRVAIVQEVLQGDDYRIVALDDQIISAYRRLPLSVTGNDISSIRELLVDKQNEFDKTGRDTKIHIDDVRIIDRLRRAKMNLESVPKNGLNVQLLDNANLSTGGDAEDVTDIIHRDYQQLAIDITRDMGLRYCGVDIMAKSAIDQPLGEYSIIEINSAPGLDNYAKIGNTQTKIVEDMYRQILLAMITPK